MLKMIFFGLCPTWLFFVIRCILSQNTRLIFLLELNYSQGCYGLRKLMQKEAKCHSLIRTSFQKNLGDAFHGDIRDLRLECEGGSWYIKEVNLHYLLVLMGFNRYCEKMFRP